MEWNCSAFKLAQNAIPIRYDDRILHVAPIRLPKQYEVGVKTQGEDGAKKKGCTECAAHRNKKRQRA